LTFKLLEGYTIFKGEGAEKMVEYKLTRAKRKSIAMYIRDGYIEVRAPFFYDQSDIDGFVRSREKWAEDKLAESKKKIAERESFSLTYGSKITYRGTLYTITEQQADEIGFIDTFLYIPKGLTPRQIKLYCIDVYKQCAEIYLYDRACHFVEKMVVLPTDFKINNAKARWGSCSAKKSVNFAWRLIMADDDAIDYILVHELAHLIEYSHSPRFWAVVKRFIPDYKEREARMRELEFKLGYEDWD